MNASRSAQDGKHRSLPAAFELRGAPDYSFPAVPNSPSASVQVLVNKLLENEWRSRSEIKARQFGQLRSLLRRAQRHSPFYAARIRNCGLDPATMGGLDELQRVPLLTRVDLRDNFEQIKCRELPPGTVVTGEMATSGSISSPVRVLTTNVTALMWAALNVRDHVWAGLDPRGSLASIRHFSRGDHPTRTKQGVHPDSWGGTFGACFVTGPAHLMDISQDVEDQISFLLKANPDCLLSYPTNLEMLGRRLVERRGELPRLALVLAVGEVLPPHMRHSIEAAFGTRMWDLYSSVEVGYIASQCPAGNGYHVHEENVLVEILDEENQPCRPGEPGKVVVTGLMNYGFPLIRCDLGDYAVVVEEPCRCGRSLMSLKEIVGRQRGQLLLPDGRVKFSSDLSVAFRDMGQIRQFKVTQHSRDHVEMVIVPMEGFGDEDKRKITEEFHAFFEFPIRVSFTLVPRIEREPGGKYLDFVCNAT